MATSTFDCKIEITDPEAVKRLYTVMMSDVPDKPLLRASLYRKG